ncbi:hypothetical protein B0H13DRAFT_2463001, partial [Mycena leptocephala]
MSSELPPELWLKVFENLPLESIRNIHAVSSSFSDLSCSFLFEEFHFYPATFRDEANARRIIQPEFERLAFWSSDKISTHVRICTVDLSATGMAIVLDSPPPLVSACFQAVSRFTNLRELRCNLHPLAAIEIPALRVEALRHLRSLHIHAGKVARPTQSSIRLKLQHFSYTEIPLQISEDTQSPFSYLSFFDSDSIHHLYLRSESMISIEHFLDDKKAMASFQNLHSLELISTETTLADLCACVSPFPAIRDLTLRVNRPCQADILPLTPLTPHLRTYNGPADFLPVILLGSAPENLTISRDYAPELLRALQASGGAARTSVTSLTIQVKYPDVAEGSVLRDALSFFPNVRDLTATVYSARRGRPWPGSAATVSSTGSRELCERLATILGVATLLNNVVLDWWVEGGYWDEIIPPIEELEATLSPVLPSLKHISYTRDS